MSHGINGGESCSFTVWKGNRLNRKHQSSLWLGKVLLREACLSGSVYKVGNRSNALVRQKCFRIGHPAGLVPASKLLCALRTAVITWKCTACHPGLQMFLGRKCPIWGSGNSCSPILLAFRPLFLTNCTLVHTIKLPPFALGFLLVQVPV